MRSRHMKMPWDASVAGMDVGLFKGAKVRAESLEALIEDGIATGCAHLKWAAKRGTQPP